MKTAERNVYPTLAFVNAIVSEGSALAVEGTVIGLPPFALGASPRLCCASRQHHIATRNQIDLRNDMNRETGLVAHSDFGGGRDLR
jgi:hypothetical protein